MKDSIFQMKTAPYLLLCNLIIPPTYEVCGGISYVGVYSFRFFICLFVHTFVCSFVHSFLRLYVTGSKFLC